MPAQVFWPREMHELWDRILPCRRCMDDPKLQGSIEWDKYVPLRTVGILPPARTAATYLILAAEPSGGGTVKDRERAIERQRSPNGVRNFNGSHEDLILQFALERWLVDQKKGEAYYVTDLSKCRLPTAGAHNTAERRYANCAPWLEDELRILNPRAIIVVGRRAFDGALQRRRSGWPDMFEISHYGKAGRKKWKEYLEGDWDSAIPLLGDLDRFARERRKLSAHKDNLSAMSPSHRWLLAMYCTQLGAIRRLRATQRSAATDSTPFKIPGSKGMRAAYSDTRS